MSKIALAGLSFIFGFLILGSVVFVVGPQEIANALFRFSIWGIIPLILLTVAINILSTVKWQRILAVMGYRVAFFPMLKIWLAGYAISYLTPVVYIGGEFLRGYILKEKHGVPWKEGLASMAVDRISEAIIWISTIFLGALVLLSHPGAESLSKIISASIIGVMFFGGIVVLMLIFVFQGKSILYALVLKPFGLKKSKGTNFLYATEKIFIDFFAARNRRHLIWVLNVSVLKYILLWLRNLLILYYLVGFLSASGSTIALGFSSLAYITPIPAALGAQEAILAAVFSGVGYALGTGTALTFILRFAEMLMVGAGVYYLIKLGVGMMLLRAVNFVKSLKSEV